MKPSLSRTSLRWTFTVGCWLALALFHPLMAQDTGVVPPEVPQAVVIIQAVDEIATEPGISDPALDRPDLLDPAMFLVSREGGDPSLDLNVFYSIGGSASNGEDYAKLSGEVLIPAGARSARIVVFPLSDEIKEERETVELQILPPVCIDIYPPPPECYLVGSPGAARAVILEGSGDPLNRPPHVAITRPIDGAAFTEGSVVPIEAVTKDIDGFASYVEFFSNREKIGEQEIVFVRPPEPGEPIHFFFEWTTAVAGTHVLTVIARDNLGARSVSEPVKILVEGNQEFPVVNVVASDPEAAEPDPVLDGSLRPIVLNTGTFTITRTGDTTRSLRVFYGIRGTAINGEDYEMLSGDVTIEAGARGARVVVAPFDDDLIEGPETVVLTLVAPPVYDPIDNPDPNLDGLVISPLPYNYMVGPDNVARVVIKDNDQETNHPPYVNIVSPESGALFVAPAEIRLLAAAQDRDGRVVSVEFFEGDTSLGVAEQDPRVLAPLNPFFLAWSNVPVGSYILTAVATDDAGATTRSEPIRIKVVEEVPPTDLPPVVNIRATDPVGSEWDGFGGTPTASFKVSRRGSMDSDLVVFYEIGGTAENGRDYEFIPVRTIIPAGQQSAVILITPISDRVEEKPETVKLSLILPPLRDGESRLFPPAYHIGRPGKAAVVIIDHGKPRLPCVRLPDGLFHVCRPGDAEQCFRVEVSTDMRHWEIVGEATVTDGAFHFVDPEGDMFQRRFYRVVPVPCPERAE